VETIHTILPAGEVVTSMVHQAEQILEGLGSGSQRRDIASP
jgi:hypothetical protein